MKGLKIRIWMLENGITSKAIATGYGCSDPVVSKFVHIVMPSRGLAQYFVKQGCPKEYFKKGRPAA